MEILGRLLCLALLLPACILESPQEQDPRVQEGEGGDEFHRPGQPCLLCHGPGHFPQSPGEEDFELAGTVYQFVDSAARSGLEGITVTVEDASGETYEGLTNRAGNFMFELDDDLQEPRQKSKGVLKIPRALRYPLSVSIQQGSMAPVEMKTKIWRNGSCAHCHGERPGAESVGRVALTPPEDLP